MKNKYDLWRGLGPYYCMFPSSFAEETILKYTHKRDIVLDPFCGRGTVGFACAQNNRAHIGYDINPVAFVWANTKLHPAPKSQVIKRLLLLKQKAYPSLPLHPFFTKAYSPEVLRFLCIAKNALNWKEDPVDRTLMAFILVAAQNKDSLSNQLPPFKAVNWDYAIRWWSEKNINPPDINPYEFLENQINRRYKLGRLTGPANIFLGDIRTFTHQRKAKLIISSPPYAGKTDYILDNWLRLWLLNAFEIGDKGDGRFLNMETYSDLLWGVFQKATNCLANTATVVVRTGSDAKSLETMLNIGCALWGTSVTIKYNASVKTQTQILNKVAPKSSEATLYFKFRR